MSCDVTLKAKGLKLTPQRRLILDIIHEAHEHLSGDSIVDQVQKRMPGVNKSTVYRTLELLEKLGCVYKSESQEGMIYHHAEEGHHHHIVCRECGETINCPETIFLPVKDALEAEYGFSVDIKHVVMKGLCLKCKGEAKQKIA